MLAISLHGIRLIVCVCVCVYVCVCVCPEFSPHVCLFLSCKRTCFAFCSIFTRTIWGFTSFLRSATRLLPTSWLVHAANTNTQT